MSDPVFKEAAWHTLIHNYIIIKLLKKTNVPAPLKTSYETEGSRSIESPPKADKEVAGVSEMPELVSCVEVKILGDACLQRHNLIEASEVITFIYDVMTDAEMDREYRHDKFSPDR